MKTADALSHQFNLSVIYDVVIICRDDISQFSYCTPVQHALDLYVICSLSDFVCAAADYSVSQNCNLHNCMLCILSNIHMYYDYGHFFSKSQVSLCEKHLCFYEE